MFMNDENKRHGQAIKIARETTNNEKKKYNSVKHLQRQQFSFTKTSIKVSLKILSLYFGPRSFVYFRIQGIHPPTKKMPQLEKKISR